MWQKEDSILIAVSGGADSMALLHGLADLKNLHGAFMGVAHLNHSLRPEADEEESFVADQAAQLGIPFHSHKVSLHREYPGLGCEEAGRMARYNFFNFLMKTKKYTRIATAHHAGDRTEQILMNLIRGCGPDGLGGIPAIRDGYVVRPLIDMERKEIISYLKDKGLSWKEDPSNTDTRFLRNRIRHQLIPLLENNFNPAIRKGLLRTGNIAAEENRWMNSMAEKTYSSLLLEEKSNAVILDGRKLSLLFPGHQARILRHAIFQIQGNLQSITLPHVEAIQKALQSTESSELHLPGKILVRLSQNILEIKKAEHSLREKESPLPFFSKELPLPEKLPASILLPHGFGRLEILGQQPSDTPSDMYTSISDRLFPLTIRAPLPGDRMHPWGRGGSRKLMRLFSEKKIPKELRRKRPVIAVKEGIIWVPGLPPDEKNKAENSKDRPVWLLWYDEKL
ncbi:tRNA lysidine(34) synthetase TilS [Desulfobotulus mexicanus]|uniref:tRNA(Ile)-lysidine synthase n=2 Tax=Desulfobotulus mexicanus TaxID=2586642 RepID=A0A5S5MFQ3_9BACT|nr:tRNA lysidine(34) synthetase TilS [Desulfobotulus mexicanus]